MHIYDAIIIGAGPAGLFAAYHILNSNRNAHVLLLEKGASHSKRYCIGDCSTCSFHDACNILCGVGGAGLFSDGKLILNLSSGGLLDSISNLNSQEKDELSSYILRTLRSFDGVSKAGPEPDEADLQLWQNYFNEHDLCIKHYNVTHMGTYNLKNITLNFVNALSNSNRFTLITNCNVADVLYSENGCSTVFTTDGKTYYSKNILFAVGKTGSSWLKELFSKNGVAFHQTKCYLGVRLETYHNDIAQLFDYSFDPKIWTYINGSKVKTHCFCRHGDVICSNYMGFPVVGGYTNFTENNPVSPQHLSERSNFNILVSTGSSQQELIQILQKFKSKNAGGILVQSLSDFMNNTLSDSQNTMQPCSKINCRYGNIRGILDECNQIGDAIAQFINLLAEAVPNIRIEKSVVYGPAIEWFMDAVEVNPRMETVRTGWFAIGDGAGLSQGIVHSAATAIIAADEVCKRINI